MERLIFTNEDLERFKSRGFEIYKSSNGKFYIRPTIAATSGRWEEAIKNAQVLGLELSTKMEVLKFEKTW